MRNLSLVVLLCFTAIPFYGQSTHLEGSIDISLEKGRLKSQFVLTHLRHEDLTLSFMLHSDLAVKRVSLNDKEMAFKKTKEKCYDCTVYSITFEQALESADRLQIETDGRFKTYKAGQNKKDYKGKIANNYGILRASEQAKWYPVIISKGKNLPAFLRKYPYTFDLEANCDCRSVYIGRGVPKPSGSRFVSKSPSKDIMLIAGDYDWVEGEKAIFINISEKALIDRLDTLFSSISTYYEAYTKIDMPTKYVMAHLPSDNSRWGGFMTYPTIVSVRKSMGDRNLTAYLSHEVAHYLFGDVYQAEGNLFWFYLESFAEYFSYKYLLQHDPAAMRADYRRLKKQKDLVRLDQVKSFNEVNSTARYLIGPFQLLAMERRIGEEKMLELIASAFSKLNTSEDGYQTLIDALSEIGVSADAIAEIETELFQRFDPATYKFVEEKLKSK
ncbi:MAG: hypothetical protein KTR30_34645 [Saprospiraceae bacterium]|nr:hypothetical protein [Saprospiraceae bacterium]